ncbi:aspartate--tRNA ligase [Cephaloticoccus capnophilus]|uniref:Aspartate--tRNA(Asp/Asn) ligase n=1 Tax=Cephaloticoccus capnophilus TaxID=1548208 RepID=A0A139SID7_9BACT|nr:aspartate--tRNA ligase [Cephaloticoccus capnophilus]KXU34306.1 aspartate--tRNA ligase [Cephaloticoccus capnophilus]
MKRTHHCGQLTKTDLGASVSLAGWVDSIRDHGGILFIDLRDRKGITQVKFDPQDDAALGEAAAQLKPESVIAVSGTVALRPEGTANASLPTGEIEVNATALEVLNRSEPPPFPLDDAGGDKVSEDLRLSYRYLDLRRPKMRRNLEVRHRATKAIRDYFDSQEFIEVETPALFKSTPEGAREYLVPSRIHPGQFYALSQSPQQFKQILMVAGVEKYFQIARCFRDEDLRADRQMEFTQVDVEASFVTREDIYALFEGMLKKVWRDVLGTDIPTPFPRLPFADAMNRYGSDKPDTRFALELVDFTELFKTSSFKVFASTAASGGAIKAINVKGLADLTQGELKALEDAAKALGAKGLAFIKVEGGEWKSPIVKFFSEAEKAELSARLSLEEGDIVFFAAAEWERACAILGRVRLDAAQLLVKRGKLALRDDDWKFLWVVDFPLMSYDEERGGYAATHHPFTAPVPEDASLLVSDPKAVRGQHYDIVLNGVELGGGSIRIHQPALQKQVFEDVLKIPADVVESRFGYMLRAFTFGAPPHGGIAFGLDRIVALLCGTQSIRDVIAFPKTQRGQDLMAQSPTPVTPKQLKELHIATAVPVENG